MDSFGATSSIASGSIQNGSTGAVGGGELSKYKVVLLGEGAVGKTSVVLRYAENKFNPKHNSTLQAAFVTKRINLNGVRVELNIWDTAGQERFHALIPVYYRNSNGALLVFDITDEHSFEKVNMWVKELRRMLADDVVLAIVGNKSDLDKERRVTTDVASKYAKSNNALYFECSAKENRGIDELFNGLTRAIVAKQSALSANQPRPASTDPRRNRNILLVEDTGDSTGGNGTKKSCC